MQLCVVMRERASFTPSITFTSRSSRASSSFSDLSSSEAESGIFHFLLDCQQNVLPGHTGERSPISSTEIRVARLGQEL